MPVTLRLWLERNRPFSYVPQSVETGSIYVSRIVLNRSALATTDTELKLMAAAAIIGLRSRWCDIGYSTPAATGTPRAL